MFVEFARDVKENNRVFVNPNNVAYLIPSGVDGYTNIYFNVSKSNHIGYVSVKGDLDEVMEKLCSNN